MKLQVKENNIRLDKYIANKTNYSRNVVQKMIEKNYILVNGVEEKSNFLLKEKDLILIKEGFFEEKEVLPENIKLYIKYEDEYLIVLNKPSGMIVHPVNNIYSKTLVNALKYHTKNLSDYENRNGIVHRLDKDTSGLIVVAKTNKVHKLLKKDFKERVVKREYTALVHGNLKHDFGVIDAPIGRDQSDRKKMTVTHVNSKPAKTKFKVIKRYKNFTLVNFELITGRTHQIRVHAEYIKHPIYNDPKYSNKKSTEFGQFLHASFLEFKHPIKKECVSISSELPKEFKIFLSSLN